MTVRNLQLPELDNYWSSLAASSPSVQPMAGLGTGLAFAPEQMVTVDFNRALSSEAKPTLSQPKLRGFSND